MLYFGNCDFNIIYIAINGAKEKDSLSVGDKASRDWRARQINILYSCVAASPAATSN
jgi:hypothetical protein